MNDPSLRLSASIFRPSRECIRAAGRFSTVSWYRAYIGEWISFSCAVIASVTRRIFRRVYPNETIEPALAEVIDAVDPDAATVVRDEDLFTPRGAPPGGMGVCDKKSGSMWSIVQSYCSARLPKQSVDPLRRQHRFSPAEEKPAVLEAEEDESYRDADGSDPEKHICRN